MLASTKHICLTFLVAAFSAASRGVFEFNVDSTLPLSTFSNQNALLILSLPQTFFFRSGEQLRLRPRVQDFFFVRNGKRKAMLDPLIYGSVEFDEPPLTMTPPKTQQHIASLPHTTMPRAVPPLSSLPKTETDRIPSYVHPNLRELTADDIKDVQEHTTLLKTASAKKAEDAKQRRRVRSYKSTETSENISTLSRRAAADGRTYICMFSPETRQTFAIRAWNELCKKMETSETTTMLHGGEAPSADDAIGIVNREGRILTVNDEWLNLIACSGTISISLLFTVLNP